MAKILPFVSLLAVLLTGCSTSEKSSSLWAAYGAAVLVALAVLALYSCLKGKKDPWFLVLLSSVLVVNCGYLLLALSQTQAQALWANRLSYLGSVCLPISMFMIVSNATGASRPKWLPGLLLGLALLMFLITASPGILPVYYKSVSFSVVDGVGMLEKEYGPLHSLYYLYLFGYFGSMVVVIIRGILKKQIASPAYGLILAMAVLVNIGVWLTEQLVTFQFEMLAFSYIISELFLLGLHLMMAETSKKAAAPAPETPTLPVDAEQLSLFQAGLSSLTKKEKAIFDCYVEGLTTRQVMEKLSITENTLKFHNKNLYGKLAVSGRKELLSLYNAMNTEG